jgi:hypothetical protein
VCAPQIFVSYVQVVGIMRTLQLDWPPALQRMVNSVDVSSTSNYISVECSLGRMDSLKKAVVQTSAIVMLPGTAHANRACHAWSCPLLPGAVLGLHDKSNQRDNSLSGRTCSSLELSRCMSLP